MAEFLCICLCIYIYIYVVYVYVIVYVYICMHIFAFSSRFVYVSRYLFGLWSLFPLAWCGVRERAYGPYVSRMKDLSWGFQQGLGGGGLKTANPPPPKP